MSLPRPKLPLPHTIVCEPAPPIDFGVVPSGQTAPPILLHLRRGDGAPVAQFLVSPPDEDGVPGVALRPRRIDERVCCVELAWRAPLVAEECRLETTIEVILDRVVISVPLFCRVRPQPRRAPGRSWRFSWPRSRRQRVGLLAAAVASLGVVAATALGLGLNQAPRASSLLGVAPAGRAPTNRTGVSAVPVLRSPPTAHVTEFRVRDVQRWRDIAAWRLSGGAVVIDTAQRRSIGPGDALTWLSTKQERLPAALVFANVVASSADEATVLLRGGRSAEAVQSAAQKNAAFRRRRDALQRIAGFFAHEAVVAGRRGGERAGVWARFRHTFAAHVPFRGDYLTFGLRLSKAVSTGKGQPFTRTDLARFAAQAAHIRAASTPPAAPLLPALLLVAPQGGSGAPDTAMAPLPLRPVGPSDEGRFYARRLSPPVRLGGKTSALLLSRAPWGKVPARALPRFVVRPNGVFRLADGELPASRSGRAALPLPGVWVRAAVVQQAQPR